MSDTAARARPKSKFKPKSKPKSKSSGRWLRERAEDGWVRQREAEGYRSRASFKLLEIQRRQRLMGPGMTVVDLGAAPGGWSQVAAAAVGGCGKVIACDMLAMEPLPGVRFIQGDFGEAATLEAVLEAVGDAGADLVISDMAPNMSGMKAIDQPRAMALAELALELAEAVLKPGGSLLVKAFHGSGFEEYRKHLQRGFGSVKVHKPAASRARSREVYLLASNYRG